MTKHVRIENADPSDHKVVLKAQTKNAEGEWVDAQEPAQRLDFPTALATVTVYQGRRWVIEEV